MMIDRKYIGTKSEPLCVDVEPGQLKFFAKATGESNPIYTDLAAAQDAGHRALPAPLTFAFSLNIARPDPFSRFVELGIDLGKVLHGEQHFEYHAPIYAGDTLTLHESIVDIYDKKGGALQFLVTEVTANNQHGDLVVRMLITTVVRH